MNRGLNDYQIDLYCKKYAKYTNRVNKHDKFAMKGGADNDTEIERERILRNLEMMYKHIGANLLTSSLNYASSKISVIGDQGKTIDDQGRTIDDQGKIIDDQQTVIKDYETKIKKNEDFAVTQSKAIETRDGIIKTQQSNIKKQQVEIKKQQGDIENQQKLITKLENDIANVKNDLEAAVKKNGTNDQNNQKYLDLLKILEEKYKSIYTQYIANAKVYFTNNIPKGYFVPVNTMMANTKTNCSNDQKTFNLLLNNALIQENKLFISGKKRNTLYGPIKALYLLITHILPNFISDSDTKINANLLKDTSMTPYGIYNTSVTFGAALTHFNSEREIKNADNQKTKLLVLNCGTGAIKYQLYAKVPDTNSPTGFSVIVQWEAEDENVNKKIMDSEIGEQITENMHIIKRSKITLGSHAVYDKDGKQIKMAMRTLNKTYDQYDPQSIDPNEERYLDRVLEVNNDLAKLLLKDLQNVLTHLESVYDIKKEDLDIMVIITGETRGDYYKNGKQGEKYYGNVYNQIAKKIFENINKRLGIQVINYQGEINPETFFLPQETEGLYESAASTQLVKGVYGNNQIIIGSFGMGRGSTQLQLNNFTKKDGSQLIAPKIDIKHGMGVGIGMDTINSLGIDNNNNPIMFDEKSQNFDEYGNFYVADEIFGDIFVQKLYEKQGEIKSYFSALKAEFGDDSEFVVGLKSGFGLVFEKDNRDINVYCNALFNYIGSGCDPIAEVLKTAEPRNDINLNPPLQQNQPLQQAPPQLPQQQQQVQSSQQVQSPQQPRQSLRQTQMKPGISGISDLPADLSSSGSKK